MEFTFKGKRCDKVMLCTDGSESDPYKAVEQVGFSLEEPPMDPIDTLAFIEENYGLLTILCAEIHVNWLAENPKTIH
jgi:hypothetical protein